MNNELAHETLILITKASREGLVCMQSPQSLHCSYTQSMDVGEDN